MQFHAIPFHALLFHGILYMSFCLLSMLKCARACARTCILDHFCNCVRALLRVGFVSDVFYLGLPGCGQSLSQSGLLPIILIAFSRLSIEAHVQSQQRMPKWDIHFMVKNKICLGC